MNRYLLALGIVFGGSLLIVAAALLELWLEERRLKHATLRVVYRGPRGVDCCYARSVLRSGDSVFVEEEDGWLTELDRADIIGVF